MWPNSNHIVKATLSTCHHIIHAVLKCERHGSERNMIDTLLVLTQTVSAVERQFISASSFQPVTEQRQNCLYNAVQDSQICTVTNIKVLVPVAGRAYYSPVVPHRLKPLWNCIYSNVKRVYLRLQKKKYEKASYQKCVTVINLVQKKLQELGCDLDYRKVRVEKGNTLSLSGMHYGAIETWKSDIMTFIYQRHSKKNISKCLHSILYTYIIVNDYSGVASFIKWLYSITTALVTQNHSLLRKCRHKALGSNVEQSALPLGVEQSLSCDTEGRLVNDKEIVNEPKKKHKKLLSQEKPSSSSTPANQTVTMYSKMFKKFVSSVQLLIGSLGLIMARIFLKKDVFIPLPHNPHVVGPLWLEQNAKEKGMFAVTFSLLFREVVSAYKSLVIMRKKPLSYIAVIFAGIKVWSLTSPTMVNCFVVNNLY